MNAELRRKFAREPFEEKIRKLEQLLRLVKKFPRKPAPPSSPARGATFAKPSKR